ncbi:MAG: hypothetical protein II008_03780 [Oscillospiraceae bacterium]|nr:hypothetical protein [Oscillospiraceae bacterium]
MEDLAREICGDKTVPLAVVLAALAPHYGTENETTTKLIEDIWEKIHDHIDCAEANK